MNDSLVIFNQIRNRKDFREGIMDFEDALSKVPTAKVGHDADEEMFPLKHSFGDGCYIREIFMPKGMLLTSKIHKVEHPYFVMKGKCSVLTEDGVVEIQAPFQGMTKPGTKRLILVHEDCTWITVHVTKHQEIEKIEKEIIAESFDEIDKLEYKNMKVIKEATL